MSHSLLDVNVLIALFDPAHVDHETAHDWFAHKGQHGWATCPFTENTFVRIVSNPRYPNVEATPAELIAKLGTLIDHQPHHRFWPDAVSITDTRLFRPEQILGPAQLTDIYLLGLCKHYKGRLATLDRRIRCDALVDGMSSLIERVG